MNKTLIFLGSILIVSIAGISTTLHFFDTKARPANLAAVIDTEDTTAPADNSDTEDNTASSSPRTLAQALQQLENQQHVLEIEVANVRKQLNITDQKADLIRNMKRGDSGEEITKLQNMLQEIPDLYPYDKDPSNFITGYYGVLTESAVKNFQDSEGLDPSGVVDEETRDALYQRVLGHTFEKSESGAPVNFTTISEIKKLANLQDQVSLLMSTASSTQATQTDLQNQITQIASDLANLQTTVAGIANAPAAPSAPAPVATSTPPPFAISNTQASNITKNSATITWTTNNPSTSEIDYSQNSTLPSTDQTVVVVNSSMVTSHKLTTLSLSSGTKYYFRVVSKDASGTTIKSAIASFITAQ